MVGYCKIYFALGPLSKKGSGNMLRFFEDFGLEALLRGYRVLLGVFLLIWIWILNTT
jgi:hypothetical protein